MAHKPSIPKGTRDFTPELMAKRSYIFDTIREIFELFGYAPIETPAMENLSTLMGKYGEEGDQLLFKVLNSGDFLSSTNRDELSRIESRELAPQICEKGLRYDLTVPFARYVVQHRHEITFPFKRYQIQPVWRADRPQKGRYREFYQCDADVVGSNGLLNELELLQMANQVFKALGIRITIHVNNRKIISGIAEACREKEKTALMAAAMDKVDKIGLEQVKKELQDKEVSYKAIDIVVQILENKGDSSHLASLNEFFARSDSFSATGQKGVEELEYVTAMAEQMNIANIQCDLSLARGLDYYTGTIFELSCDDFSSSLGGGGRYDDLTSIFGLRNISGVGISFGAERIYDVMEELNLFPQAHFAPVKVLFVNFGHQEQMYCYSLLTQLRANKIPAEIYPEPAKLKKQMNYANQKAIPYVALVGEQEMQQQFITLKDMESGEQYPISIDDLISKVVQ